jgi:glucokinase
MNRPATVIGIDVGGTKTAGGLVRLPEGECGETRIIPTQPERGGRAVLDDVLGMARELAAVAQKANRPVSAIGLGVCELVDRQGKLSSANCIPWLQVPVREELSTVAPVVMEADVRAAALAESCFGAGRGRINFLYVTIGTGISCCLVVEGEPFTGARGLVGTMASSPLALPCAYCGHLNAQTLEQAASGPGLVASFRRVGGNAEHAQDVLSAATQGHPGARQVVESASRALGSQVALLVNTLDPEAVITGGGLGLSEGLFWDQFVTSTRLHLWSDLHRHLPILRAECGADAGWLGAAIHAWRKHSSLNVRPTPGRAGCSH